MSYSYKQEVGNGEVQVVNISGSAGQTVSVAAALGGFVE